MQISVFFLSGRCMSLIVEPTEKVNTLKFRIAAELVSELGFGPLALQLVSGAAVLSSDASVVNSGLHDGSSIKALVRPLVVLTASHDRTAKIWNAWTGDCIHTFVHDHPVISASYSHDGSLVLTSSGSAAMAWSSIDGACRLSLDGIHGIKSAVFSSDDHLILTASPEGATIWNSGTRDSLVTFGGFVDKAVFSSDDKWVLTATTSHFDYGGSARIWDATSGQCLKDIDLGFEFGAMSAVFSPDNTSILVAKDNDWDDSVILLRADGALDFRCPRAFAPSEGRVVSSVVFSPDGANALAAVGASARIFDLESFENTLTLDHEHIVRSVVSSFDGSFLLTAAHHSANVWSAEGGGSIQSLRHGGLVTTVSFAPIRF